MENRNFKIIEANLIYLLLAIVFITFGASVQAWNLNIGLIVTEYIIIFLPVLIFGKILGIDFKRALRIKKIKMETAVRIIVVAFFLIPIVALVNLIPISLLSAFGKFIDSSIPTPSSFIEFLIMFFVVAISAGFCEEVFFRGLILNAYESGYNKKIGAISAAILFGIFHFNIQNLFGPIIIGLMAAYLIHLTDSILSAIILHISNNGIAVIADFLTSSKIAEEGVNSAAEVAGDSDMMIFSIIFFMLLSLISVFIIKKLVKKIENDCFYFKPGEVFAINNMEYTVIEKDEDKLIYGNESELYDGRVYDMSLEKCKCSKELNCEKPRRITKVWENKEIGSKVKISNFIPLIFIIMLYIFIFILHINYTG